jgi:ADP-heptose:LPS heptosyltransferase
MEKDREKAKKKAVNMPSGNESIWVEPVGGFGDMLMVSGVLKLAIDRNPDQKYKLARRTRYLYIFKEHPAIEHIGFPPKQAKIIRTDYWAKEKLGAGDQRPFQILARAFGLATPVEEKLYLPGESQKDDLINQIIPWKEKNIVIAPATDSPRKMMEIKKWQDLVEKLASVNTLVIQVGKMSDRYIKGAYSLLGLTTPRQLVSLLKRVNVVITSDNFIMHAAHLVHIPAIVIFGPTPSAVYGYDGQTLIQAPVEHCDQKDKCLGKEYPQNYSTECPLGTEVHCMNKVSVEEIFNEALRLL